MLPEKHPARFIDEVCRNCGSPAPLFFGCVIGPPPGTCGECEEMTDDQKVTYAHANGIPVGSDD